MSFQNGCQFRRVVNEIKNLLLDIHCAKKDQQFTWTTAFQFYLIGLRDGKMITVKQYNAFMQMSRSAAGYGDKPFPGVLGNKLAWEIKQILWDK